jgi:hypothetical protein
MAIENSVAERFAGKWVTPHPGGLFLRANQEATSMAQKTRLCEICMKPIDPDRLESFTDTRLCSDHAAKIKKHGGEFIRAVSQETTSKQGGLKKNYGGVNTEKIRNQAAIEALKIEFEEEKWAKPE